MNPWKVCSCNFLIIHEVVNKCKASAGQEEAMIAKFLTFFLAPTNAQIRCLQTEEAYPNKLIDDSSFT